MPERRPVQPGEDVHQRRLARARGPHDRGEATRRETDGDAGQRVDRRLALTVAARRSSASTMLCWPSWAARASTAEEFRRPSCACARRRAPGTPQASRATRSPPCAVDIVTVTPPRGRDAAAESLAIGLKCATAWLRISLRELPSELDVFEDRGWRPAASRSAPSAPPDGSRSARRSRPPRRRGRRSRTA